MEIKRSKLDQIEIFELEGRIDANNSKDVEDALVKCVEEGNTKIIVDLAKLDYISSSGLRVFLFIAKKLDKIGSIHLCSLQPNVSQLFIISGFNKIFTLFGNKEDAIKSIN
jgi:stage II sporulation protein AA (anti-sigma F factor antagonist)